MIFKLTKQYRKISKRKFYQIFKEIINQLPNYSTDSVIFDFTEFEETITLQKIQWINDNIYNYLQKKNIKVAVVKSLNIRSFVSFDISFDFNNGKKLQHQNFKLIDDAMEWAIGE